MKNTQWYLFGIFALALPSCTTVCSQSPVGLVPQELNASEWGGVWYNGEGSLTLLVTDSEKGLLEVAWIEDKSDGLVMESFKGQVRKGQKWVYLNFKEEGTEEEPFMWGRIKKDGSTLFFWLPDSDQFQEAVKQGLLKVKPTETQKDSKGKDVLKKESTDLILIDNQEKIIQLIEAHGADYFEWDKPMVFFKMD